MGAVTQLLRWECSGIRWIYKVIQSKAIRSQILAVRIHSFERDQVTEPRFTSHLILLGKSRIAFRFGGTPNWSAIRARTSWSNGESRSEFMVPGSHCRKRLIYFHMVFSYRPRWSHSIGALFVVGLHHHNCASTSPERCPRLASEFMDEPFLAATRPPDRRAFAN